MYIDSHLHFWKISRGDYSWMSSECKPLYRDFGPSDLFPLISKKNITQAVVVQAADTVAETEFILEIANKTSFISGVVGWVDFESRDVVERIDKLIENKYLKGFRPMIHDIANENWMLNNGLELGLKHLIKNNLTFDALVRPKHLKNLYLFAKKYNDLPIVINHMAKPNILNQEIDEWQADMKKLSMLDNIYCKYSGIVTEIGADYNLEQIKPYTDFIFESFDTARIMWGSDWPVLTMAEKYENWFDIAHTLIPNLSNDEKMNVFLHTARNFYRI